MRTSAPQFKLGASRQWLQWLAIGLLCLIGVILLIRAFTGTTLKEQKALMAAEKAANDLANKPAGNAEGLSAKLERARLDAEKEREKEAVPPPGSPGVSAQSGPVAAGPVPVVPASTPSYGSTRSAGARAALPNSGGQRNAGEPSDEQLDAYAASKEQAMRDGNRKIAAWEAAPSSAPAEGVRPQGAMLNLNAMGQEGRAVAGAGSNSQAANAVGVNPTAALAQAWLQSQQPGMQGSSQEQFRRGLGNKSVAQAIEPQGPVGAHAVIEGDSFLVTMRTAVSSDIAGDCRADVAEDVYDSLTQRTKLIPNGSRVICTYDSQVVQGQERLLLAFTRLVFPSGYWINLGGMDAADRQGAIGAPAEVNTRFWKIFGNSFLIAAVTRAAEPKSGASTVTINTGGATAGATAAGVLAETARKTLDRNLNIKNELRVKPGDLLRVVVNRDMLLDPAITKVR